MRHFTLAVIVAGALFSAPAHAVSTDPAVVAGGPGFCDSQYAEPAGVDPDFDYHMQCFFTPTELAGMISSKGANFNWNFVDTHAPALMTALGSEFAGLNEAGQALVLATLLAYELKPYGTSGIAQNGDALKTSVLLGAAVPGLSCDEYVGLALQLYYRYYNDPATAKQTLGITPVGWRTDSAVQNHTQISVSGLSIPLLLDPNYGIVARASFNDLLLGTPIASSRVKTSLNNRRDPGLRFARVVTAAAITGGKYKPSLVIYAYNSTPAAAGADPPLSGYQSSDFTAQVAAGPSSKFWIRTIAGALFEINQGGMSLASPGIKAIATGLNKSAIYELSDSGAVWQQTAGSGWVLVSSGGIKTLASGLDGNVVFLLNSNGDLWRVGSDGWVLASPGIAEIATGLGGSGTYELSTGGSLFVYTSTGWTNVPGTFSKLLGERNGEGVYVIQSDALKRIGKGGGTPTLVATAPGAPAYDAADVHQLIINEGGRTVTMLKKPNASNLKQVFQWRAEVAAPQPVWSSSGSTPTIAVNSDGTDQWVAGTDWSQAAWTALPFNLGTSYSSIQLIAPGSRNVTATRESNGLAYDVPLAAY